MSRTRLLGVAAYLAPKRIGCESALLGGFGSLFNERGDLFWMREEDGMTAYEFDRFGLRSATHESLEFGIDHAVLRRNHCVARLLGPRRRLDRRVKRRRRDRHLGNGHEMRHRLGHVGSEVLGKRFGL